MSLEKFKNSSKPILITGETGSGKSQLAADIHKRSKYRDGPFVKLNLSTLSDELFESELFGHVRGSFTGALADKPGLLSAGNRGTVFLDEIGELSIAKQVKLLHLLDDGSFFPVGSTTPQKFMGRFVFATNKNLEGLVKSGSFREDLFYRIRFCKIELGPLRLKGQHALHTEIHSQFNNLKVLNSRFKLKMSDEVLDQLVNYRWPGNYRELQNTLEYLVGLGVDQLSVSDLPAWVMADNCKQPLRASSEDTYYHAIELFERNYFEKVMYRFGGQINKSAQEIGLSKVTLISKLKKYGIDRRAYKCRGEAVGF